MARGSDRRGRDSRFAREHRNRLDNLMRLRELLEFMMDNNGFVAMSKEEVAITMAQRTGLRGAWMRMDGRGDRRLVETLCNMTRDQRNDELVAQIAAGYVISYAPSRGGLTLVSETGEMSLDMLLHMLAGDLSQQQNYMTVWRRRLPYWEQAAKNAALDGDGDLARLMWRTHDKIKETGFAPSDLVVELLGALAGRGFTPGGDGVAA